MITHHLTYEQYHNFSAKIGSCQLLDKFGCRVYLNTDFMSSGYRLEFDDPHAHTMFILTYSEYI